MTSSSKGPTVPRRLPDFGKVEGLRVQAEEAIALEAQIDRMNALAASPLMGAIDRARLQKIHGDIARITSERRRLSEGQISRLNYIIVTTERCLEMAQEFGGDTDDFI